MPVIPIERSHLLSLLGEDQNYSVSDFENLCFGYGIELEEVTNQREIARKEWAAQLESKDSLERQRTEERLAALSTDDVYKVDIPANRHDLLSPEGIAASLNIFRGVQPAPKFQLLPPKLRLTVKPNISNALRPYVQCAILRNLRFTPHSYNSFVQFQERLHAGLARKRTLASVGTHDLDTVTPPFTYEGTPKNRIRFLPLKQTCVCDCTGNGLAEFYANDRHISRYIPLVSELSSYPVIYDARKTVMSLPPIINSEHSRITLETRNVFIDCTAPDYYKATLMINQLVCAFARYCEQPFSVEAVEIHYEEPAPLREAHQILKNSGKFIVVSSSNASEQETCASKGCDITPHLSMAKFSVSVGAINARLGTDLTVRHCSELLRKMSHTVKDFSTEEDTLHVSVLPNRSDVLDPCDLVEDVAIAFGYNNIPQQQPPTLSTGSVQASSQLTRLLRAEMIACGFSEMLNFSLCSREEAYGSLNRVETEVDDKSKSLCLFSSNLAVHIANPLTQEFQVARPSLLPGALKTLRHCKKETLPLHLFELGRVVHRRRVQQEHSTKDASMTVRTQLRLSMLTMRTDTSALEDVQGILEHILVKLQVADRRDFPKADRSFSFVADEHRLHEPALLENRRMALMLHAKDSTSCIGYIGVVHPTVLAAYEIKYPFSYAEMELDPFL